MVNFLFFTQLISAILVIFLITIQTKGGGLGGSFGQSGSISFKRRGVEKLIFRVTFFFSFIFLLSSILRVLV